jgi:hypothetical protein
MVEWRLQWTRLARGSMKHASANKNFQAKVALGIGSCAQELRTTKLTETRTTKLESRAAHESELHDDERIFCTFEFALLLYLLLIPCQPISCTPLKPPFVLSQP